MEKMHKVLQDLELTDDMHKGKLDELDTQGKEMNDMKDTCGGELPSRFAKIETDANTVEGRITASSKVRLTSSTRSSRFWKMLDASLKRPI